MNLAWVKPLWIRSQRWAIRNAPNLLMGMGAVSGISAVIFAVKATPAAMDAAEQAKIDKGEEILNGDREGTVEREDGGAYVMPKLTARETLKACWKFYIPATGMELFSLMCFFGAHGINLKRQAVLAGLYSTAEQALIEYQKKVVEMIGEKPEKEIRAAVAQDHIDRDPPPVGIIDPGTDYWVYYKNHKFRNSYYKLREIQNDANAELIKNLYLSEAELLEMFDPDRRYIHISEDSRMIGFNVDRLMEFSIEPTMTPDHQPAMEVNIYDKDGKRYLPSPGFSASL